MNNIVLCGFMGCGKSTVGRLLAKSLGRVFIDTDEYIENEQNMTVSEIFEQYGESGFRDIEHKACVNLAKKSGFVIATGGGALTFERNAAAFADDRVIFMNVPFDEIERRIDGGNSRPLFQDRNKALELYNIRLPLYKKAADCTVDAVGSTQTVARKIAEIIEVK